MIFRVGHRRGRSAPDRGASRSVGDHHTVAEKLSDQLDVRRFAAACAGAGKFKERLLELAALHRLFVHGIGFLRDCVDAKIKDRLLIDLSRQRLHDEGLAFGCRANVSAVTAAKAVLHRHRHGKAQPFCPHGRLKLHALGCLFDLLVGGQHRANRRVRANESTLVTLDAEIRLPFRHVDGHATLLIGRAATGKCTILHAVGKGGDGQLFPFLPVHHILYLRDKFRGIYRRFGLVRRFFPSSGHLDLNEGRRIDALINGTIVHVDDLLALIAIGLHHRILQVRHCFIQGNNIRQLEEGCLHDHVEAPA